MTKPLTALALFAAVLSTSGCATQQQQLQAPQDGTVQTALQRRRFDLRSWVAALPGYAVQRTAILLGLVR